MQQYDQSNAGAVGVEKSNRPIYWMFGSLAAILACARTKKIGEQARSRHRRNWMFFMINTFSVPTECQSNRSCEFMYVWHDCPIPNGNAFLADKKRTAAAKQELSRR